MVQGHIMKLSKDDIVYALPEQMKRTVNDAVIMSINNALEDNESMEIFKSNFVTYSSVLSKGKYSVQQYIDAVKFCSFVLMGMTNLDAYTRTFPMRIKRFKQEGKSRESINSFVSGYKTTKLVTDIMTQAQIPLYVLNQGAAQKAINAQLRIIRESKNDLAVVKAADSLLNHLAPPVETKVTLDIAPATTNDLDTLRDETRRLAQQQRQLIEQGVYSAKQVAEMKVVGDAEYTVVN